MADRSLPARVHAWAAARPERVRGHNPWELLVGLGRSISDDRVPGLAAEMAFFAMLSFVPLLIAVGAALGFLERFLDPDRIARGEQAVIDGVGVVFNPDVTGDVIAPFVTGLLSQQRGGLAVGGVLATLWLGSRVFAATVRALNVAYEAEQRRGVV
ncbi:MAG: hypothetical protein GEU81_09625, partial [Nitriliruptorales bacterium]|nr:hypothetical protein [Nitriliruptorales bacterium]